MTDTEVFEAPRELRWTDPISGLPCGVFRVSNGQRLGTSTIRNMSNSNDLWFGGFAVPPGHPYFDQETPPGVPVPFVPMAGVFGDGGVLFWFGRTSKSRIVAMEFANRAVAAVPPEYWMTTIEEADAFLATLDKEIDDVDED